MNDAVAAPVAKLVVPPSRLFWCAIAILPLMSLPQIYVAHDFYLPVLSDLCMLPVAVVDSFKMIFHETGHLAAQWIFAQPATMVFYPADGTAATHFAPRNPLLLALIYLFFTASAAWLYAKKDFRNLRVLCIMGLLHGIFAATAAHQALGMCMGHGGEMLAGTLCAWLCLFYGHRWTARGASLADAAARAAGTAAGIYLVWENMMFMIPIILRPRPIGFSPVHGRMAPDDITLAAQALGTSAPVIATFLFMAGLGCICFIGCKALKSRTTDGHR